MVRHVSFMSTPGQAWRPVPSELHPLLPSVRHPVLCIVRLSSLMWRQARLFSCSETHMQRYLIPAHANWWKPLKATGNLARNEHIEVVQKYFIRREEMFQQGTGTRRRSVVKWHFAGTVNIYLKLQVIILFYDDAVEKTLKVYRIFTIISRASSCICLPWQGFKIVSLLTFADDVIPNLRELFRSDQDPRTVGLGRHPW